MIALPLRAASLYHQFKGAVMPHKLLNAIEQHLASPDTSLDNGDDCKKHFYDVIFHELFTVLLHILGFHKI
jgi:hypothetical protein